MTDARKVVPPKSSFVKHQEGPTPSRSLFYAGARKVALIGGTQSREYAPWDDATWEIWSHASARKYCRRVDLYFDMHPRTLWGSTEGKPWDPTYHVWLNTNRIPIMMQEKFVEVPASIRFPRERCLTEFRPYMNSQFAWMAAYALMTGVTHVGLFGIQYTGDVEREIQNGNAQYWVGVLEGRGVQVLMPPGCTILSGPKELYGYESHGADGKLIFAYSARSIGHRVRKNGIPAKKTVEAAAVQGQMAGLQLVDPAKAEGRLPLRQGPEPVAWSRSGHEIHA